PAAGHGHRRRHAPPLGWLGGRRRRRRGGATRRLRGTGPAPGRTSVRRPSAPLSPAAPIGGREDTRGGIVMLIVNGKPLNLEPMPQTVQQLLDQLNVSHRRLIVERNEE